MSRSVLAPLAVALSALLAVPPIQADPASPLFVVEQQRAVLVSRLARQWSDTFATLPKERRLDHEQLSNALFALRADRLFAVTLAGDAEAVEAVLSETKREAVRPRAAAKALGDATADLTYTPINPCRILDTRSTAAGPLAANVARTFVGFAASFTVQGGASWPCDIPNGIAAMAMNVYAVNPTNLGFIKVWPANGAEPLVSTVNYQPGITAIATGTVVPVDASNENRFVAKSPAAVDFVADVVGYFKSPGDATSLEIKLSGERVMRYEYSANSPNVIGGSKFNYVDPGVWGASIGGGGTVSGSVNRVSGHYGTVAGGMLNLSGPFAAPVDFHFGTVGGGWRNNAAGYASVVAGGELNTSTGGYSVVGGGLLNTANLQSVIVGGQQNWASDGGGVVAGTNNAAEGKWSFVGGGSANAAGGAFSAVLGGMGNVAQGDYSVAVGRRAKTYEPGALPVTHHGVLAFADGNDVDFHSAASNEFAARATGGVRFVTAIDVTGLPIWSCGVSGGAGGSWGCTSDRDAKSDLIPLDGIATLERLAALPVYQWVARDDPRRIPHAGPTAQDFMAAFWLGDNDKMIGFADAQGVAFAAIQGLNAKLAEKDREIAELKRAVEILFLRTSPDGRVVEAR